MGEGPEKGGRDVTLGTAHWSLCIWSPFWDALPLVLPVAFSSAVPFPEKSPWPFCPSWIPFSCSLFSFCVLFFLAFLLKLPPHLLPCLWPSFPVGAPCSLGPGLDGMFVAASAPGIVAGVQSVLGEQASATWSFMGSWGSQPCGLESTAGPE